MEFKGRVDDMLLIRGVNVFPNAVRDVVNRIGDTTTGNIRIQKPGDGAVVEPPVRLLVEVRQGLSSEAKDDLAKKIIEAVHHQLRFRVDPLLQDEGVFEVLSGSTGKMKLVERVSNQLET